MLQNIGTQTHKYPLIQQNQPKSNTNSIQGTQKHKLRNTKEHKPVMKKKKKELPRCEEGRKKKKNERRT